MKLYPRVGQARARCGLAAIMLLVVGLVAPVTGFADQATESAKLHNELGKKLFNLGLFREAAEEYQKAYEAKPVPAFLFNLAQCYKRMTTAENLRKSIFFFRAYLQNAPDTPARHAIEAEIAKLERALVVAERPRPKPIYKKWWFWTVIGAAVTGAAVGTAMALRPEDIQPSQGSIATRTVPAP